MAAQPRTKITTLEEFEALIERADSKERGLPLVTAGAVPAMPDLAVEIQQPAQSDRYMSEVADYYLAHGNKMVVLVYPDRELIEVLSADDRRLLTNRDTIDFAPVIPGLTLPVKLVFLDPLAEE